MMLRNYICNGEFQVRFPANAANLAAHAAQGYSAGTAPGDWPTAAVPDDIVNVSGINNGTTLGFAPGFGGGAGIGGSFNMQILDRDFHNAWFPTRPERFLWFNWTTPPNPAPCSQGSGWEIGSPHVAPAEANDWRIDFLECGTHRCAELLGSWIGFYFCVLVSGTTPFPIRPALMTGWMPGDFMLHDLGVGSVGTPYVPEEVCGWFFVPDIPALTTTNLHNFGIDFTVGTTCTTPNTILFSSFKLCKWPYLTAPTVPASDIKYLVEKQPAAYAKLLVGL